MPSPSLYWIIDGKGVPVTAPLKKIADFLDEPVWRDELVESYRVDRVSGLEGPDRQVIRTAIRSMDLLESLGWVLPPERFTYLMRNVPGWSGETHHCRRFGIPGRWWLRVGQIDDKHKGYINAKDFDEWASLI